MMPRAARRKTLYRIVIVATLSIMAYSAYTSIMSKKHRFYENCGEECVRAKNSSHYLVQTAGCNILEFTELHPVIATYTYKNVDKLVCSTNLPLTEQSGLTLIFHKERIPLYGSSKHSLNCSYQVIFRTSQPKDHYNFKCDSKIRLIRKTQMQKSKIKIAHDGILVSCYDYTIHNAAIYRRVHTFIQPRRVWEKRQKFKKEFGDRLQHPEKLSVIIMGTDSVSRGSLIRHMPNTFHYLTHTIQSIDLHGYIKVGDNTYPNIVALLMGISTEDLENHPCKKTDDLSERSFDDCPLIWRNYSSKGYVTVYAEDSPNVGSFHHNHIGFVDKPTDYYNRPYFLASDRITGHNGGLRAGVSRACQSGSSSIVTIHDYSLMVAKELKDIPYFAYYWAGAVTHDRLEGAVRADEPSLKYLKSLNEGGYLNHTVLFFISDHGMRSGEFRTTYPGMLEERLPFAHIVFPKWFLEKYPEVTRNLHSNARRLVSSFDFYATLVDIVDKNYSIGQKSSRTFIHGQSLFKEIPESRTCSDASIPDHYCACEYTQPIDPKDDQLLSATQEAIDEINWGLKSFPKCAFLKILKVLSGRMGSPRQSDIIKQNKMPVISYITTFVTEPGLAILEATVKLQGGRYELASEVSRINRYGNQSHCINDAIYRKYCYCKDLLPT